MIIDCHGHYTTAPAALGAYRDEQRRRFTAGKPAVKERLAISDDEIRASVSDAQLRFQRERGTDLTVFSPRASWMGHHIGDAEVSRHWTEHCNDLIARVCGLFPASFAPAAQLPQSPGAPIDGSVTELRRCVGMGFVGCNVSPDPSGGHWNGPVLGDRYWYPLYEALCELDVPAMIHVSGSCNDHFHTTSSHYLSADTTAFMQLVSSNVLRDFPQLRLIIPHGGGAVPYHWGRYRGILQDAGIGDLDEIVAGNLFVDTCVYHQAGIDLLLRVVDHQQILFASEMIGAVRGVDPNTGRYYDDTLPYVMAADLDDDARQKVLSGNALRVFPRLRDWTTTHAGAYARAAR